MLTSEALDAFAHDYYLNDGITTVDLEERAQLHSIPRIVEAIAGRGPVLEMGFGTGLVTGELLRHGVPLEVVEGSPVLAREARSRHTGLVVHDAMFETFAPTRPYGAVLALHVLEHVDDPVGLLGDMRSWLAPDGALIAVVPNAESLHRRIAVEMGLHPNLDDLSDSDILVGHQRVYDLDRLVADLDRAGYDVDLDFGYLLKTVPNSMMLAYPDAMVEALNTMSATLPTRDLANIGVRAIPRRSTCHSCPSPAAGPTTSDTGDPGIPRTHRLPAEIARRPVAPAARVEDPFHSVLPDDLVPDTPPGLLTALVLKAPDQDPADVDASVASVAFLADTVVVLDGAVVDWEDPRVTTELLERLDDEWIMVLAAGERLRMAGVEAALALLRDPTAYTVGVQVGLHAEVRFHRNNALAMSGIGEPDHEPSRVVAIAPLGPPKVDGEPAVTVIVPTFNRPDMLRRCLAGLCVQTDDDLEVIVVNDGGLDVSSIVAEFEDRLDVRLLTQDHNGGAATAANAGLAQARGRYAHFQADDDTVLPQHIQVLRNALDAAAADGEPVGVVFGPAFMLHEDDTGQVKASEVVFREEHDPDRLLWQNFIVGGTAMFDRRIACEIGGMNTDYEVLEDWDFWLRMARHAPIHYVDCPTAEYRMREGTANVTTQARPRFFRSLLRLYDDHPVDADGPVAARRAEQIELQSRSHEEDYAWERTVAIIGNGDLSELVACLGSVLTMHGTEGLQLIVHELRSPTADAVLGDLAQDATVCLHATIDEELCRRRIERQAGGRITTVLRSTDRPEP